MLVNLILKIWCLYNIVLTKCHLIFSLFLFDNLYYNIGDAKTETPLSPEFVIPFL